MTGTTRSRSAPPAPMIRLQAGQTVVSGAAVPSPAPAAGAAASKPGAPLFLAIFLAPSARVAMLARPCISSVIRGQGGYSKKRIAGRKKGTYVVLV